MDDRDSVIVDEEAVRRTAYFLWQQDGRPEGRHLDHWFRAWEQHVRELAYDRWLAEGTPEGKADVHWQEARRTILG